MLVKLGMYPRIRLPYGESAAECLCSGGTNSASVSFFFGGGFVLGEGGMFLSLLLSS